MKKKLIGMVGVDSGQVLLCDPCYIKDEWHREDAYHRDQVYDVTWEGKKHVIDMGEELMRGASFVVPMRKFGRKSMNTLVREGIAVERPHRETGVFGYNGCCKASTNKDKGGQLYYKMGHAGAGVAVSSGYGDGTYPVFAHYNKEGRVAKVEIIFDEEV